MNKLTKIGVSALAGSLALTAAHAAEVSLSGGVAGSQFATPAAPSPFASALSTATGIAGLFGKLYG